MSVLLIVVCVITAAILLRLYQKTTNGMCKSTRRLDGKVAIVTGGTAGMGLEIATDFAKRGAKVIIACPFEGEGTDARETIVRVTGSDKVVFKVLDLASFASTRRFATDVLRSEDRLDILVNNAGGVFKFITEDGLAGTMQVNYFGHFLLTLLLLPLLNKSTPSRIVNVCSNLHWIGYVNMDRWHETGTKYSIQHYCDSKLCMLYFSNELRKRLKGIEVVVNCVDPGAVGTKIFNAYGIAGSFITWFYATFYKTPLEGAQNAIYASVDVNAGTNNGSYIKDCRKHDTFRSDCDEKWSKQFWEESKRLVKLQDHEVII